MTILQQNVSGYSRWMKKYEYKFNIDKKNSNQENMFEIETRRNYMSCISLVHLSLDYLLRIWSPACLFEWGCDVDETVLWHRELWQQSQEPEELLQWLKWQWCRERWELDLQQTQSSDKLNDIFSITLLRRFWSLHSMRLEKTLY